MPNSRRYSLAFAGTAAAWLLLLNLLITTLGAQQSPAAYRQTPRAVVNGIAVYAGHYDPNQMLRVSFVLAEPHPAEERQFLEDVQNKQSPLFHQFLGAEEWTARFGPSATDEKAVADWAVAAGFHITNRYNHRLVVDAEAPAGVIEHALAVQLNRYQLPAQDGYPARMAYSNDRDPMLPSALSQVDAALGLNSIEVFRPGIRVGPRVPRPDYVPDPAVQVLDAARKDATSSLLPELQASSQVNPPPSGYFTPKDMFASTAYDYGALMNQGHCCNPLNNPTTHTPRETSIAIAAFGDVSLSDISNFQAAFPYLAYNVQKIAINGGYTCVNTAKASDDNCVETTLDTEWSLAMANSQGSAATTSKVYVYEASGDTNAVAMTMYSQILSDAHARVMSTSWGGAENTGNSTWDAYNTTMASLTKVFSNMVGQGWTLVAASGDQGATGGCDDALRVVYPASDPNFVAAGGTYLQMSSGSNYEVAWTGSNSTGSCSKNGGGSTGGASEYFGSPSYQSGLGFSERAVPDLALDAVIGHDMYYNGAWAHPGGTSVVAPMLAGFFAQENAYLLSLGAKCGSKGTAPCAPMGNANYPVYAQGLHPNGGHNPFYDVVNGCNTNDITQKYTNLTAFCAKKGYDQVTGWGSGNMLQLAWAINWELAGANGIPNVSFTGPAKNKWYNSNQTVSWKINDYAGTTGAPGTGIAGETQGWDSLPADPYSEVHGATGNSFYSGPQFVNDATGCLAFVPNGCSGGIGQGCHTVHVRGWNNIGWSTGDNTYGPLCYDTVPPTTSMTTAPVMPSGGWMDMPVTFTLSGTDPGGSAASGVANVYYAVNNAACTTANPAACTVYSGPFKLSAEGTQTVTLFALDKAGNFGNPSNFVARIDITPPVTTATPSGNWSGTVWRSPVSVALNASDAASGVAGTFYTLDGGPTTKYTGSAFSISTVGSHPLKYWSTDVAGNVETAHTLSLTLQASTSTTMTVSPNPVAPGQALALAATVKAIFGGTPTGTVAFTDGATTLGSGTLSGGVATLRSSLSVLGKHWLRAAYSGAGSAFPASLSTSYFVDVAQITTTTVSASPNPATVGKTATFTATVKGSVSGTPTGSVQFFDGATQIGTATLNTSGVGTLATAALVVGSHSITVGYGGDLNDQVSKSSALSEVINASSAPSRVVWIPDFWSRALHIQVGTGTGQKAITVNLPSCYPNSVTVNSNKAYVVCTAYNGLGDKILVYNAGTIRTASAGTLTILPLQTITSAQFNSLIGITFDASNNLWVASYGNNQVDEIMAAQLGTASPTVVASLIDSPSSPVALAFDGKGALWVIGHYGGGILLHFPASQLGTGSNAMPDYCLASGNLGAGCQYINNVFLGPEGLALFDGDVWVANNATGASGNVPGRELVDLKFAAGTGGNLGTLSVNGVFGSSSSTTASPFVCPGALFAGSVHLWVDDESYGETNPQCGAAGDVTGNTGGIFAFTPQQLAAKVGNLSEVLAYTKLTGRPGFGGLFVENDQ